VQNNLVTIGIIAAIMGVLLVGGLAMQASAPAPDATPAPQTTQVTVLPQKSLEMLDPVYSEKAVFQDDTIRVSFKASETADGFQSELPLWIHNVSDKVVTVLWDRCSFELPSGNTVNVADKTQIKTYSTMRARPISIAPSGDLFDTVFPISEITWNGGTWSTSTGVLDKGPFRFVLAVETGADCGPLQIHYYVFRFVIR
jgi:hypothetical protein